MKTFVTGENRDILKLLMRVTDETPISLFPELNKSIIRAIKRRVKDFDPDAENQNFDALLKG